MAELVSQIATLRRPCALVRAIIGCDLFAARKTVRDASPACLLPLPACCHLLPTPATSTADACIAKFRPEVARVRGHPGEGSEQSVPGRVGRSLEHKAASFHTWHKNSEVARRHPGVLGTEQPLNGRSLAKVLVSSKYEAGPGSLVGYTVLEGECKVEGEEGGGEEERLERREVRSDS